MNPFKKRCTKQLTLAALSVLMAIPSAHSDDQKPLSPKQLKKLEKRQVDDQNASQLSGRGFSMPGVPAPGTDTSSTSGELMVGRDGTGVYEGYVVTHDSRRPIAIGFRGTNQNKLYLAVRRIEGREGSFLAILMHPNKDHEHVALYRIDPRARGKYVMTRLSMENSSAYVASFITVENVNPELTLNIRGGHILISSASEEAKRWASRHNHDPYFSSLLSQEIQFDPAGLLDPTPAVEWTDGPASADYQHWTGDYRGLFFTHSRFGEKKPKFEDRLTIDQMDITQQGSCSVQDPCYQTTSNFSFLNQSQDKGDRMMFERFPGMYTFNPVETLVDGDHVEYGEYIGIFLRTGMPKDGIFESKFGTENKLYLIDPSNSDNVMVVKKN